MQEWLWLSFLLFNQRRKYNGDRAAQQRPRTLTAESRSVMLHGLSTAGDGQRYAIKRMSSYV
jgi:hypothetical protein